ncbi:acyltransferase family protein [Aetokthonos hydrillicola Thurmond2011]|jgi:predicted acyltransferase|uniref:Acyltransferase family protein n=1 Tax=Aetokthonos hydrillicola Thurmond2011 TaxID=2712845 RepID=A0AAP5IFI4_9CYAN|nr:acyltransferase family protein [Aetokthonos hydrillicola]MBO3459512.1 acyltransferase family protein [Aetokthonos hydrillicola CCALA 1050]MBW4591063.1 acyltransferase family protein [Aetokthonos hydrillicola CCALA 1050]MDR9899454.1 acyltransferase family protein [Aetokthonos hydrillicola Thurmond2011]
MSRLSSLDVFRGIAIAGMILANMASIAEPNVYPPLLHADWHGCTPTDLVFPFFLFIVGVAMTFSLSKYTDSNKPRFSVYQRIIRRAVILFALGLLLNGFWNKGVWTFDLSSIRIMGVLQRISLSYLLASVVVLNVPRKGRWIMAGVLLIGYWLAMMYVPVPGYGAGVLTREGNFGAYIDRLIIPKAHLYKGDGFNNLGDPEGLFSTIPAVVSVLAGYFSGEWIRNQGVKSRTSLGLALFGIGCVLSGWFWDLAFPLSKKMWTSSFVVFTTGWALLLLAACYELIEVRALRRWGKPFKVMGLNAIFVFVASVLLIKIVVKTNVGAGEKAPSVYDWIYQNLFASWAGAFNGSLLLAIATLLFWLAVAYVMYWQRWFIKV